LALSRFVVQLRSAIPSGRFSCDLLDPLHKKGIQSKIGVGMKKIFFRLKTIKKARAYHVPGHPFCDGFFALVELIVPLGFVTRKVNQKSSHPN
jgi:hypothetical protein